MVKTSELSPYDWARRLAEEGIDVAPGFEISGGRCGCLNQYCYRPGKHPLFQEDRTAGSRSSSEIQTWWRRRPTANLIVHTGWRSRLVVIDADTREGGLKHFAHLCDRFPELELTFRVRPDREEFTHIFALTHAGDRVWTSWPSASICGAKGAT
jgi:hypothetical protein